MLRRAKRERLGVMVIRSGVKRRVAQMRGTGGWLFELASGLGVFEMVPGGLELHGRFWSAAEECGGGEAGRAAPAGDVEAVFGVDGFAADVGEVLLVKGLLDKAEGVAALFGGGTGVVETEAFAADGALEVGGVV